MWRWLQEGCIDFAVPMIYMAEAKFSQYQELLMDWQERRGGERLVVSGSSTLSCEKASTALLAELGESRTQNADGWCVFSYGSLADYWADIRGSYFVDAAKTPDMPWKSAPTKGMITGYVTDETGAPLTDAKVVMKNDPLRNFNGNTTYNHLTGGDGFFAILNVPPGADHELTFSKNGRSVVSKQLLSVVAGQVTQVDAMLPIGADNQSLKPGTQILECRGIAGALNFGYDERKSLGGNAFADTTAKSAAPGLIGLGGRYIGTNGLGARAEYRPVDLGAGNYNVYLTLSPGGNNYSPGAVWEVMAGANVVSSGTVDLLHTNTAIVNKWYKLCGPVSLPDGPNVVLRVTNTYTESNVVGGRFVSDSAKFEHVPVAGDDRWMEQ